jgi:PAS domain S-box-containing protein
MAAVVFCTNEEYIKTGLMPKKTVITDAGSHEVVQHPVVGLKSALSIPIRQSISVFDSLPDPCFVISDTGHILYCNFAGGAILGLEGGVTGQEQFTAFLKPAFQISFAEKLAAAVTSGRPERLETEVQTLTGKATEVEMSLSRFTIGITPPRSLCLILARDITDRKKQELDLLRFTNLAHYTVNPIEITDINGHMIYVNPAFERQSGYTKEEVVGKNPNIFGSGKHPKSFWQNMWKTISAGKVWVGEVENRRRNGEPFYTQLLISPIVANNGLIVGYFGIHRDISEQRQLEQQLVHAQKMESIGMLAAGLAHEVGNPLTSISSIVQILQRTSTDGFIQEKLELMKSQISRISRIIRDLVDFSRRSTYEVQLTDINKNIRDAIEIVRIGKKAKDITFTVSLDESVPLLSLVPDQVEQVFINLLINAVDALFDTTPPPGKTKSITVRSARDAEMVQIGIEDNGKGIRDEDLQKIFEPFFTTKKVGEGTGLGLWVSYGIIKSFRGEITVKSTFGAGTVFTIRLPLRKE